MSPNDRMTARGSSPTHRDVFKRHAAVQGFALAIASQCEARGLSDPDDDAVWEALQVASAAIVDLPALRREAAAQALEEAARIAEQTYPRGGAHTYASENADRYIALEDACEVVAERLRGRAAALREGRSENLGYRPSRDISDGA